jgi:hypothetical protein
MTRRVHQCTQPPSQELLGILQWTALIGAVTAEALAHIHDTSVPSARARLRTATRRQLLARHQLLADRPALYTVTRAGTRAVGLPGLDPARVSAANSLHTIVCANAAAALQRCYPGQWIVGERELRREERRCGAPVASAVLRHTGGRNPMLHRPDLVMWPSPCDHCSPIAVEVELTTKAPRRLEEICRAWARSRDVSGVLYLATPAVERALRRAIDRAHAAERIVVVPLDALPLAPIETSSIARSVSSGP